ncbi:hypothetical protein V3C99_007869 [Haemonchus contortus]
MDISTYPYGIPQRFHFLPTRESDASSGHTQRLSPSSLLFLTRCLLSAEFVISMGFNLALLYTIRHGQNLSILLCIIATSNCIAAAGLLCGKRPMEKASAIAVYVIWKILQEVILVPVLVIFTALIAEGFGDSVTSFSVTHGILVVLWIYALFSMVSVIFLGHTARTLWKTKMRKRRSSFASVSTVTQPLEQSFASERSIEPLPMSSREEF